MKRNDEDVFADLYKMMKDDSRVITQLQQTTLSWSSVSVGVLLLFGLNLWKESSLLAFGFFVLILPSASIMFFNVWLMEVARVMRIGRYLYLLENKIQECFSDNSLLMYEHWLKEEAIEEIRHFTFGHKSAVAIYMGICVFSHIIAVIIFWTSSGDIWLSDSISIIMRPAYWAVFYGKYCVCMNYVYKLVITVVIFAMDFLLIIDARKRVKKYIF